jgi:hypothetical protein
MPQEQRYIQAEKPREAADLIIDGSGVIKYDLSYQFVALLQRLA